MQRDTALCEQIPNTIYSIKFILDCCCLYYQMFVVFNRKMYVVDFYFQLFRSPMPKRLRAVLPRLFSIFSVLMNLQSRIPSPCTRWIFMLMDIHLPSQHAHKRASGNLGRAGKKNLEARGKHWESERRVTIVVVSFFTQKIWPQIVNLCWFSTSSLFLSIEGSIYVPMEPTPRTGTPLPSQRQPGWMLRGCFGFLRARVFFFFEKKTFWNEKS